MLVLTRKLQEQIVIGENIKVTVLRVKGGTVRLGIEAPRHVRVVRSELPPVANLAEAQTVEAGPALAKAAATTMPETPMARGEKGACSEKGSNRRSEPVVEASLPRCSPPLAAYLVSVAAHAS